MLLDPHDMVRMHELLIALVALAIISPHLGTITKIVLGPLTAFFDGKEKKRGDDLND